MLISILMFFLGVLLAPVVRPLLRPLFVELVRAGVQTADEVTRLSAQARESIEDAAAEAEAQRVSKAKAAAEPYTPPAQEAESSSPPPPTVAEPPQGPVGP